MPVNKVVINQNGVESVLVDITDSTVTPETLAEGETAYGANGEKITGTMKAGSYPVQSDWLQKDATAPDYIKNKPFGGGSNSVSWASAGIDPTTLPKDTWVKVSDAVVTMEDFEGVTAEDAILTWYTDDAEFDYIQTNVSAGFPQLVFPINDTTIGMPVVDSWGNAPWGVEFRSDGVYFFTGYDNEETTAYPISVTVPGFGKFESKKSIDSRYLPEGLQTETIGFSDKLVIESLCDENGSYVPTKVNNKEWLGFGYKVSDANIPVKSCRVVYTDQYELGNIVDIYGQNWWVTAQEIENGFYRVLVMDENGNTTEGGYCATDGCGYDTGLYMYDYPSGEFTFFGGAVFEIRTPKPIDKKYLPDDIGGVSAEYVEEKINDATAEMDQTLSFAMEATAQHTLGLAQERIDSRTPPVTAEDNGKFLRVVDGAWSAVSIPNAEGVGF